MFYMLRIADEFKDHEDDCRWRPYLPVPRGLVTLDELGRCFAVLPVIQLALNLWLCPPLALALLLIWSYIFLMSKEFFAREWLRQQPVAYLLSHMLIVPLVDVYITACDWLVRAPGHSLLAAPSALWIFVVLSFFNGLILEVGRKIRSSAEEETGVETYSVLWGKRNALAVWMGLLAGATGATVCLANTLGSPAACIGAILLSLIATFFAIKAWLDDRAPCGQAIENSSGLFVLLVYLSVGFVPLLSAAIKTATLTTWEATQAGWTSALHNVISCF